MGSPTNVGNVTVAAGVNVTFASIGSTYATGGLVRTINVGAGGLFDLRGNIFSTDAGTGLIKSGAGVFGTGAGAFTGGFTLNAGTVVVREERGMGSGASHTLTLNGGTVAANNVVTRTFNNTRFGGGIIIGGNVQFGELASNVSIASSTANLSFSNNVSLGSATRTLTLGNNGFTSFHGVISNTSGGLTFAANADTRALFSMVATGADRNTFTGFSINNSANTFTGDININDVEVSFDGDGGLGNAANDIIIDGGQLSKQANNTDILGPGRQIFVGDGVGTSIRVNTGFLVYNNAIADKPGETGSWAKYGMSILELGGASTYTGNTSIVNGSIRLTTGNNRLPTGTVVSFGEAGGARNGTLDLNGRNQEIAGLNSTTGTPPLSGHNNVHSIAAATLTVSGNGTYVFSDGTAANTGLISGAISLVKNGAGSQTLGGNNFYNGGTTILGGEIRAAHDNALGLGAVTIASGALLSANGTRALANTIVNQGMVSGATGGELLSLRGEVSGAGSYTGDVDFAGLFRPGTGIGTVSGMGNFRITGTLDIEVNGAAVDKLNITGDLTLDGDLSITEIGEGFPGTPLVIAECTGVLSGNLTAPAGYSIRMSDGQVILSEAHGYANWAETHAGGQAAQLDFDRDEVANGIEYFMGETGSTITSNPSLATDGTTHSVAWPRDPNARASFKIQISETLSADDWTDIVPPHAEIDESDPNEVVFTLPPGTARLFVRLSVTVDP